MMMTAEIFTEHELTMLRQELMGGSLDVHESAELIKIFLAGRGYGVEPDAVRSASMRLGFSACTLQEIQKVLSGIALVQ